MTVDDDLDTLYGVRPEEFTALRKELVAASRKRGDAEAAKSVAAARRPTVAAWVVNHLVRADPSAQRRMSELSDELRAAHAEMDGARIRELTGAHRRLVHELAEKAFAVADVGVVSAALRDDVTATLQAAIADAEVADRLGRLAKAEQWSGFGRLRGVLCGRLVGVALRAGPVSRATFRRRWTPSGPARPNSRPPGGDVTTLRTRSRSPGPPTRVPAGPPPSARPTSPPPGGATRSCWRS